MVYITDILIENGGNLSKIVRCQNLDYLVIYVIREN